MTRVIVALARVMAMVGRAIIRAQETSPCATHARTREAMSPRNPTTRSYLLETRRRKKRQRAIAAILALSLIAAGVAVAADRFLTAPDASTETPAATADVEPTGSVIPTAPVAPSAAVTVTPEPSGPATITISAVGDMIFDRRVKELVRSKGGLAPLAGVAKLLARADVTVGNLESPLSNGGTKAAEKDVTFRGDPRGVQGLAASGFDFLSLGNNHVLDYGSEALVDTIELLDENDIGHAGAGADRDEAWTPAVLDIDGTTIAFLSFSHILPPGFVATSSKAGLAQGRNNMDSVEEAIASAKADYDYVLVSFHWGVEYVDDANGDQVKDAHRAIDAGADMVLSHHPHVIQGIEFYKNGLIAYSLGDFVFDHYSRKTGEAFILDASLGPNGITGVQVTPVYLDSNGAPDVVTGSEADVILKRLKTISAKHGANVRIKGDTATVTP